LLSAVKRAFSPPGAEQPGRSTLANTVWLALDKLVKLAVGLVVGVWVARYLGPDQYGALSFAIAFAGLFGSVATLGLDSLVVRDLVKDSEPGATLGTAFVLKLLAGLLTALLAIAAVVILRPGDLLARWLVGISAAAVVFQSFDVIDFWFQSQVQSRAVVLARTGASVATSAVRIALILAAASVVAFAWASLAEAAVAAIALVAVYGLGANGIRSWRVSAARARQLLGDSWPLIFSSLVVMLYMRIDQVMLGEMLDSHEVGVYSVAVRLSETSYLIPSSIVAAWLPGIVEAHATDERLFLERLQRLYNVMALLGYAVALPTLFLAGPVVRLVFGEAYGRAAPMLIVLSFATLFINLGIARSAFLTAMNWPKTHLATVLAGAILNVLLNLYLIPRYGGLGAAWASFAAYWLAAHGACFFLRRMRPTGVMLTRAILLPKVW
jgi:O-antigen/teichoic acid export membrane protein